LANRAGLEVQPCGIDILCGQNDNSEGALLQFTANGGGPMSALVCVFFRHERLYGLIHQMQPLAEILCNLAAYVLRPTYKEFHRQPFLELSPTVRLIALGRSGLIQLVNFSNVPDEMSVDHPAGSPLCG
jgi:hypothetical protein